MVGDGREGGSEEPTGAGDEEAAVTAELGAEGAGMSGPVDASETPCPSQPWHPESKTVAAIQRNVGRRGLRRTGGNLTQGGDGGHGMTTIRNQRSRMCRYRQRWRTGSRLGSCPTALQPRLPTSATWGVPRATLPVAPLCSRATWFAIAGNNTSRRCPRDPHDKAPPSRSPNSWPLHCIMECCPARPTREDRP